MLRLVIAILSLGPVNCLVVGETIQIKMFNMPIPIGTLAQGGPGVS